ncbi:hypothetical protein Hanom_Chr02g00128031 [Helianthus anomalus]
MHAVWFICQGTMASSASSAIYDDVDLMEVASDDEFPHIIEINSSDDESDPEEDPDYVSDDDIMEDAPIEDDILVVAPQLNDFVIVGHPWGERYVEFIPLDVLSLVVIH